MLETCSRRMAALSQSTSQEEVHIFPKSCAWQGGPREAVRNLILLPALREQVRRQRLGALQGFGKNLRKNAAKLISERSGRGLSITSRQVAWSASPDPKDILKSGEGIFLPSFLPWVFHFLNAILKPSH